MIFFSVVRYTNHKILKTNYKPKNNKNIKPVILYLTYNILILPEERIKGSQMRHLYIY